MISKEEIAIKNMHRACRKFANAFQMSVENGLDSVNFAKKLMTTKEFETIVIHDTYFEWCDDAYLFHHLTHNFSKFQQGKTLDSYLMWYAGYLYKYWINTRKLKPKQVYKIMPIERLQTGFNFYHT